ncbi:alpha/beta fold hydrolase [Brevibacterium jeotgali]|uniref:Pimeloyl-ACP methyl ester carboxylesterase n=1 Tax=Brevibacterium jeotgali TaxID=1262550 RepID=A0A2H1L7F5_9MICO|nr:alpha/beta hydrolase [Brevibacterium jeotgali]SMY12844.1 Pimeloyl-ACP methyl ester carboxylesterase [Brevibacterium jeotgali]
MLIHGFRGDHHGLALIAHELRDRDVWVPDLPGFGSAPVPRAGLDLAAFTTHIQALCAAAESASGARPTLVGHSFGSVLAAHAYAHSPDISCGVGLLSPIVQPALEGSARLLTQLTRLYYAAGAALPDRLGSALLANPFIVRGMSEVMATSSDRMTRRFIHDQHARHFSEYADRRSLAEAYRVSTEHTVAEVAAELARTSGPLLVVAGDDDLIAPIEAARGFVADLRERHVPVDAETLTGVGHLLHYERPAAVADAIETFARTMDQD